MSIIKRLQRASFKGAPFLMVKENTTTGGRKTVTHEFANRDTREVEDLGKLEKKFTVQGIIAEPNYFDKKAALIRALESEGAGQLVHPFFGTVNVQSTNYTCVESMTDLSKAVFTMNFEVTVAASQPTSAGSVVQKSRNTGQQIQAQMLQAVTENFEIGRFFELNYLDQVDVLSQMLDSFEDNLSVVTTDREQVNILKNSIGLFRENIVPSINDPALLSQNLATLFDNNALVGRTPSNQLDISNKLFEFGDNFTPVPVAIVNGEPINTVQRQQRQNNRDLIVAAVKVNALKDSYIQSQQLDYFTDSELDEREDNLEVQFQELLTFFENKDNLELDEVFFELQELRDQTRIFFDEQRVQTFRIVDFSTPETSSTITAYRLYGDVDNAGALAALNKTREPTFLGGDIKVFGK